MKKYIYFVIIFCLLLLSSCNKNQKDSCIIYLDANGGELTSSQIIVCGNCEIPLPTPTKNDYIFKGWYNNKDLLGSEATSVFTEENLNYYFFAKWESVDDYNQYLITSLINSINELPDKVTIDDEKQIIEAYNNYINLPENLKEQVTNYDQLIIKVNDLSNLVYDKYLDKLCDVLIEKLNYIPSNVTLSDKSYFEEVDSILDKVRSKVYYLPQLQDYLDQELIFNDLMIDEANDIKKGIALLPSIIQYEDIDKVNSLKERYDYLTDNAKSFVQNAEELNKAYNEVQNLEYNINYVTFVVGKNVYNSKEQLFTAFFSDFYKFINYQNPDYLKKKNINSVDDFLTLASSLNGGNAQNLTGIGNIAGNYMLSKDLNGVIEDQPIDIFIGYCYQNNLYTDLLPFFYNFFAYWRIDEEYASSSNYGADFFAEAWAPTVDIAKFFYYNETTSYVQSDRVIDCLTNISNVTYGYYIQDITDDYIILNQNITLRGYHFLGWYDNPDFNGEKLTVIKKDTKNILYARWEDDAMQQAKDSAALVDNYIYNLTPSVANASKENIAKVRKLYDALSVEAKKLVTNYNILLKYEKGMQ